MNKFKIAVIGDQFMKASAFTDALATAPHYKPAQALLLKMIEERT